MNKMPSVGPTCRECKLFDHCTAPTNSARNVGISTKDCADSAAIFCGRIHKPA
eukprot:SAG31_NODE_27056_length_432_cov_0.621622_1_plen_52_part_01